MRLFLMRKSWQKHFFELWIWIFLQDCDDFLVMHLGHLEYLLYTVTVKFSGLGRLPHSISDVVFTVSTKCKFHRQRNIFEYRHACCFSSKHSTPISLSWKFGSALLFLSSPLLQSACSPTP